MKNILIILNLLGLYVCNMAYGSNLPEFYGIYAMDGTKLTEMKNDGSYEFQPQVRFILYSQAAGKLAQAGIPVTKLVRLSRMSYVRNVIMSSFGQPPTVTATNKWADEPKISARDRAIEIGIKPVAGNPEQVYLVPRPALENGRYTLKAPEGEFHFYVNRNEVIKDPKNGADCVDYMVDNPFALSMGDIRKVVPCQSTMNDTKGTNNAGSNATPSTDAGAATSPSTHAPASEEQMMNLARENKCFACHAIDKKVLGPAWRDVATRYHGKDGAEDRLVAKVSRGGSGVWGPMPEISHSKAGVSQADIRALVQFILSLK